MAKEFTPLTLNEKPYTFRALNLDQLEELEPEFELLQAESVKAGGLTKEARAAAVKIVLASLSAKHPVLTVEDVRKLLTVGTLEAALLAVRGVSQIEPSSSSGEAVAGSA
jgi:hypothetical protein